MKSTNNLLGRTIRTLRETRGLSAQEMPELLAARGFPIKYPTYMGYESGNSTPNADLFLALCDIFQVYDVLHTFGYGASMYPSFDSKELRSVPFFRLVDEYCYATGKDSKPVFEYFFLDSRDGNPMYIFSRRKPNPPDSSVVAKLLGLNSIDSLYAWGLANGYWTEDLVLSPEERSFILRHRELASDESSAG